MSDLFSELSDDHRHLLWLCTELTGRSGLSGETGAQRKAASERLVIKAAQHEVAEERVVWPLVRRRVQDGDAMAVKALRQEAGAKRLLYELHQTSTGATEFTTMARHLATLLRGHVILAESQVFPRLRLQVSDEESERLGAELIQVRAGAPTGPHPHTAAAPPARDTVGRLAGVIDRARDAVTRRDHRRAPGVSPEPRG